LLNGAEGIVPRWSLDGQWIYFRCNQALASNIARGFGSSRFNPLCRVPATGGNAVALARDGASAVESPDGKWIYYSGPDASQLSSPSVLRRIPSSGGASEEVVPSVAGRNFDVVENGIWYLTPNTREGSLLQFYDLATKKTRTVYRTSRPVTAGLTISPD